MNSFQLGVTTLSSGCHISSQQVQLMPDTHVIKCSTAACGVVSRVCYVPGIQMLGLGMFLGECGPRYTSMEECEIEKERKMTEAASRYLLDGIVDGMHFCCSFFFLLQGGRLLRKLLTLNSPKCTESIKLRNWQKNQEKSTIWEAMALSLPPCYSDGRYIRIMCFNYALRQIQTDNRSWSRAALEVHPCI